MSTELHLDDKHAHGAPASMLEVYMHAISSPMGDEFLDSSNLGLGNYNKAEYWQQIQSFRNGLYADSGLTRRIMRRAVYETKRELARECYRQNGAVDYWHPKRKDDDSEFDFEEQTMEEYVDEHADTIWENLGGEETTTIEMQVQMIERHAGIDRNWVPPHWRMLKMRHEASRSKGARLIDNLFERVREVKDTTMEAVGLE